ncbi:transglutaminase-like domain-containing protein [Qipengyuania nanhaisediminis]|uniref:transglutaminase-like domain-containing protein n=1 Tax=Qipengyuania nanhaisediminis TaxID=604088 RepID=UPI0038B3962C
MSVKIHTQFGFTCKQPTSALLQFEVASLPEQDVLSARCDITDTAHFARIAAQDNIGERIWLNAEGQVRVEYEAEVAPHRQLCPLDTLDALLPHDLPGETVQYLMDSRYCRADEFQSLVEAEFSGTEGGARIAAIRDWISDHFDYVPGSSNATTTATDSFVKRQGICRDYAHVLVTLARASTIPARYVACYAPGVDPQDFHAIAQVFLADPEGTGGTWQPVDATGMADLANAALIGVGRDAADVSFVTSFGAMQFDYSKIAVNTCD